jgi:hypothetical protein
MLIGHGAARDTTMVVRKLVFAHLPALAGFEREFIPSVCWPDLGEPSKSEGFDHRDLFPEEGLFPEKASFLQHLEFRHGYAIS